MIEISFQSKKVFRHLLNLIKSEDKVLLTTTKNIFVSAIFSFQSI